MRSDKWENFSLGIWDIGVYARMRDTRVLLQLGGLLCHLVTISIFEKPSPVKKLLSKYDLWNNRASVLLYRPAKSVFLEIIRGPTSCSGIEYTKISLIDHPRILRKYNSMTNKTLRMVSILQRMRKLKTVGLISSRLPLSTIQLLT